MKLNISFKAFAKTMRGEQALKWQNNYRDFKDVYSGIGCCDGTFSLQGKPDSKPYQVPPRCVAYVLWKPFKEELEWLKQQDIITPPGVGETAESCYSFVLVLKPNKKVKLCLDPVRLNQALLWLVHRRFTLNDIFSKLNNVKYLSLIDANSRYQNLKLDKRSSYLTVFTCQFGRYRCKGLPVGAAPAGDMFQWNTDKIFKDLPNVFSIADDILDLVYNRNGKDHNDTLWKALQICWQVKLKLNKDKCHFKYTSVPFLERWYLGMEWDLTHKNWKHLQRCHLLRHKRNFKHFLE